jgi:hypothetical protein
VIPDARVLVNVELTSALVDAPVGEDQPVMWSARAR